MKKIILLFSLLSIALAASLSFAVPHPASYINDVDVAVIKAKVNASQQPWASAYNTMISKANAALSKSKQSVVDDGGGCKEPNAHYYATDWGYSTNPKRHDLQITESLGKALVDLGLGYIFTKQSKYADKAIDLLYHFCLNPTTYMEPTGHNYGPVTCTNNAGDVEILFSFTSFFYAMDFIWDYPGLTSSTKAGLKNWVTKMLEPKRGLMYYGGATDMKNNWEDWRLLYLSTGAVVIEDWDLLWYVFDRWKYIMPFKIAEDGTLPLDITREQSVSYSMFSLDPYTRVADIARKYDVDLLNYTVGTKNLQLVYDFHSSYFNGQVPWPRETTSFSDPGMGMFEVAYSEWRKSAYLSVANKYGRPGEFQRHHHHPTLTHGNRFQLSYSSYVAKPKITPLTGYFLGSAAVSITSATSGAEIRYTTNGATPTQSSTLYNGSFNVSSSVVIKARAFKSGLQASPVAVVPFTKSTKVADPTFDPPPGNYGSTIYVTMTCATPNAEIHYTLFGEEVTLSSVEYTQPLKTPINRSIMAKAFIQDSEWQPSNTVTAVYTIGTGVEDYLFAEEPGRIQVGPNPMVNMVTFKTNNVGTGRDPGSGTGQRLSLRIVIYDNAGNIISHVGANGRSPVQWDGTIAGQPAKPGIYFYELYDGSRTYSGKLIKIK